MALNRRRHDERSYQTVLSLGDLGGIRHSACPGACPVRRRRRPDGSICPDDGTICPHDGTSCPDDAADDGQDWQEAHGPNDANGCADDAENDGAGRKNRCPVRILPRAHEPTRAPRRCLPLPAVTTTYEKNDFAVDKIRRFSS